MARLNAKLFGTPRITVDGAALTLPYKSAGRPAAS